MFSFILYAQPRFELWLDGVPQFEGGLPMGMFYPNSATLQMATELRTALAASKLHLYKSTTTGDVNFVPTVSTTKAELQAAECDFDGYDNTGVTITNFNTPLLDPAGGASIQSPIIQIPWTHDTLDVGNIVRGFWLEDAGGIVRAIGQFPVDQPVQGPGQGVELNFKLVEPSGVSI